MTKNAVATTTKKKPNAVAKSGGSGLPAHLAKVKMTGAGTSTAASDNLIPMGRVLQKMSPEVEKKAANYIKGAEPGDILIKNAPNPLIKGEEGFLFQPCYFESGVYVEWLPRSKGGGGGGGFVARHDKEPADTVSKPDPQNEERMIRVRKNGNLIVETRYHGGFIIVEGEAPQPVVLPFSGSGHGVSKAWMMLMNRKVFDGVKADSFAILYRFKTVLKEKNNNSWHLFEITDAGEEDPDTGLPTTLWVESEDDYKRGKELSDAMSAGDKRFNDAEAASNEEVAADGKM